MTPSISVVIPAYNAAAFVAEAIASALDQELAVSEIVVVDDGSTDQTSDVAAAALRGASVRSAVIRQPNGGVPVARNAGLLATSGELVTFLDADDLINPDHFARIVPSLEAHPEAPMAFTDTVEFDANGDRPGSVFEKSSERRIGITATEARSPGSRLLTDGVTASLLMGNFIPNSTTVIRRSALARTGAFDPVYWIGEDRDLYLRLSLQGPFVEIEAITGRHRIHPASVMATRDDRRWAMTSLQILAAFRARYPAELDDPALATAFAEAQMKWHGVAMHSASRHGTRILRATLQTCRRIGHPLRPGPQDWLRAIRADASRLTGARRRLTGSA